jgi:hypothetical protein
MVALVGNVLAVSHEREKDSFPQSEFQTTNPMR